MHASIKTGMVYMPVKTACDFFLPVVYPQLSGPLPGQIVDVNSLLSPTYTAEWYFSDKDRFV